MTPSPTLPLKGKGVTTALASVVEVLPLKGELDGVWQTFDCC